MENQAYNNNGYLIDKLYEAVEQKGHVCVGLDTSIEYVPQTERARAGSDADAVLAFNKALIDSTADIAACYKVQIAYYEAMGRAGLEAYAKTLDYLRNKKCLVIADIKRSDIADTALQYAKAHFEGDFEADFVTLSPYMGMDSIEPWLSYAQSKGKGAFVLLRTSNKGRHDFQEIEIGTGEREKRKEKNEEKELIKYVYNAVGDALMKLAETYCGRYGYGAFGAVVGADPKTPQEIEQAKAIRQRYKNLFFLIPGFGAQGGAAEDACLLLNKGNGGVVNASRSILKAWVSKAACEECLKKANNDDAAEAAREAVIAMRDALRQG